MIKLHMLVLSEAVREIRTRMLTRACCVQTRERKYIHDFRSLQYLCSCFTLIEGPLKTQGGCVCVCVCVCVWGGGQCRADLQILS